MKTIFHVGHSKTGSTSLQSTFFGSRDQLIQKGVLYPVDVNGYYNNHKLLSADLMAQQKVPRHILKNFSHDELQAARKRLQGGIRTQIEATQPQCLLLSSESRFGTLPSAGRKTFRKILEKFGSEEIEIVAYIRRPSKWYLSALNQWVRRSSSVRPLQALNLKNQTTQFAEDYGVDHVHLRPFAREALVDGDVTADFCAHFLTDYGVTPESLNIDQNANESISNEAMDVVRRFRERFFPTKDHKFVSDGEKLVQILMKLESDLKMPKPQLRAGLADYLDYKNRDLVDLRNQYGLVLPGYDYDRAEKGEIGNLGKNGHALEDLVEIDRDAQAELISRVSKHDWIRSHSKRAEWFDGLLEQINPNLVKVSANRVTSEEGGASNDIQPVGETSMNEQTENARTLEEQAERDLAVALARAIFREANGSELVDKEARQQAWAENRRDYLKQGRGVLKQLRRRGFELVKSEEEAV